MDRKRKILIASLLDRIEVALKKKYGKAGFLTFLDSKLHIPFTGNTSGYTISSR
jgi:hypothetical protein